MKSNKTIFITGANSGIGKQAAFAFAKQSNDLILLCRNLKSGEQTVNEIKKKHPDCVITLLLADMSDFKSLESAVNTLQSKVEQIDVLIHNAAIFNITQKQIEIGKNGLEKIWAANHLGVVYLTDLLMPYLEKSQAARVLTISSKGLLAKPFLKVDFNDPEFKSKKYNVVNAYYQSKLAQIMYTYWLSNKLKHTDISVNCIRVPAVQVDLSRHKDMSKIMKWLYKQKFKHSISAKKMAHSYEYFALNDDVKELSGKYFDEHHNQVNSNKFSKDLKNIEQLMQLTYQQLTNLKEEV